jgi:ribosome biogenesis protein SSF1/2
MNYDRNTKRIELRHYLIQMTPVGLSKSVKRLLTASKVPDFSRYTDIADYVLG